MTVVGQNASQDFLDGSQYTENGILHYEFVFGGVGAGFISTGGIDSTKVIFNENPIPTGARVLDVGCGIGGPAKFLNDHFDADVLGVDLASNCIRIANKRHESNPKLNFLVADATSYEFEDSSFDLIYSRDVILHIASKDQLFSRLLKATKPGGKLIMTDYCCGPQEKWDDEFKSYVAQRGYTLVTVDQYKKILEEAGWVVDRAEDKTEWFKEILETEKSRALANKKQFLEHFTEADFEHLMEGWDSKLVRVPKGHQRWGYFVAHKPE
jgi:phosphoethanolamine N-methyltransferase